MWRFIKGIYERFNPQPWTEEDRAAWLRGVHDKGKVKRPDGSELNYQTDIVERVNRLPTNLYDVKTYGALNVSVNGENQNYDCLRITSKDWNLKKPTIILSSAVHGYERETVEANFKMLEGQRMGFKESTFSWLKRKLWDRTPPPTLADQFNIVSYICVNPHGYEYGQRLGHEGHDPNRGSGNSSARNMMEADFEAFVSEKGDQWDKKNTIALDLHTTPIKEDIEFRKQRAAMDGKRIPWNVKKFPNGAHGMTDKAGAAMTAEALNFASKVTPTSTDFKIAGGQAKDGIVLSTNQGTVRSFFSEYAHATMTTEPVIKPVLFGTEQGQRDKAIKTLIAMTKGATHFQLYGPSIPPHQKLSDTMRDAREALGLSLLATRLGHLRPSA